MDHLDWQKEPSLILVTSVRKHTNEPSWKRDAEDGGSLDVVFLTVCSSVIAFMVLFCRSSQDFERLDIPEPSFPERKRENGMNSCDS
jgi:hypothetical protein